MMIGYLYLVTSMKNWSHLCGLGYLVLPFCLSCLFLFMCMGVGDALGAQKKILDPLELELQVIVSIPTWVLGTELHLLEGQHLL